MHGGLGFGVWGFWCLGLGFGVLEIGMFGFWNVLQRALHGLAGFS